MASGRGGKTNLYNVYLEGKLIASNITSRRVSEFTGCNQGNINTYAAKGITYKKIYTFKCVGYIDTSDLTGMVTEDIERNIPIIMRPGFENEWDKARFRLNPNARR